MRWGRQMQFAWCDGKRQASAAGLICRPQRAVPAGELASTTHGGMCYKPGDLVFLHPKVAPKHRADPPVDRLLALARIRRLRRVLYGGPLSGSEDQLLLPGSYRTEAVVQTYALSSSGGGLVWRPERSLKIVSARRFARLAGPLPPGTSIAAEDSSSCSSKWGSSEASCSHSSDVVGGGGAGVVGSGGSSAPMDAVDLFCGYGGLSLGLEKAGLASFKWACDLDHRALETYSSCHPQARTFHESVVDFLSGVRRRRAGYPCPMGDGCAGRRPLLVAGGPPCQGFSRANIAASELDRAAKNVMVRGQGHASVCGQASAKSSPHSTQSVGTKVRMFLTIVFELHADVFILENVAGLLSTGDTAEGIITAAVAAGYSVSMRLLVAGGHGLATDRRRVFFVGKAHAMHLTRWRALSYDFLPAMPHMVQALSAACRSSTFLPTRTSSLRAAMMLLDRTPPARSRPGKAAWHTSCRDDGVPTC